MCGRVLKFSSLALPTLQSLHVARTRRGCGVSLSRSRSRSRSRSLSLFLDLSCGRCDVRWKNNTSVATYRWKEEEEEEEEKESKSTAGAKPMGGKSNKGPCCHCGSVESVMWRKGPADKPVLCNPCGAVSLSGDHDFE